MESPKTLSRVEWNRTALAKKSSGMSVGPASGRNWVRVQDPTSVGPGSSADFFLKEGTRSVLGDAVNSRTPSAHIKGWERAGGWSNLVPQLDRKTIYRVRGIWAGHPTYF